MPGHKLATLLVAIVLASACAGETPTETGERSRSSSEDNSSRDESVQATGSSSPAASKGTDPRRGGFEIGLGEWAITAEAQALRPGPVTFVIHNRGTMPHGFEIELEGDSSGHGSGELFKAESELLQPGESTRMSVTLSPGVHKIECLVDGHDDMGMEDLLEVRVDAPLVKEKAPRDPGRVSIADFAFAPEVTKVPAGTRVTWNNNDSAEHTVTAGDGTFESDHLAQGETFSFRFDRPGNYAYRCAIHPEMKGAVQVR